MQDASAVAAFALGGWWERPWPKLAVAEPVVGRESGQRLGRSVLLQTTVRTERAQR